MHKFCLLICLFVLCAAGCRTSGETVSAEDEQTTYGEMFVLEQGSSTSIDGFDLRFDGVSGDSRCPANTTCVWEGVAHVNLSLIGDESATPIQLEMPGLADENTEPRESQSAIVGGFEITVHAVNPYPGSNPDTEGTPERGAMLSVVAVE